MSIIALLCMVIHWRGTIVFIAPGLLYYTASNVPVVAQGLHKSIWLKGVQITNVVCIPHSRGCIELSMQQFISSGGTSPVTLKSSAVSTIGKYVRLAVPEVSAKSHPFTFFTAPQRPKDEITVRSSLSVFANSLIFWKSYYHNIMLFRFCFAQLVLSLANLREESRRPVKPNQTKRCRRCW